MVFISNCCKAYKHKQEKGAGTKTTNCKGANSCLMQGSLRFKQTFLLCPEWFCNMSPEYLNCIFYTSQYNLIVRMNIHVVDIQKQPRWSCAVTVPIFEHF